MSLKHVAVFARPGPSESNFDRMTESHKLPSTYSHVGMGLFDRENSPGPPTTSFLHSPLTSSPGALRFPEKVEEAGERISFLHRGGASVATSKPASWENYGANDSLDDFVETTDTETNIEAAHCLREGIDSECLLGDTDQVFLFTTQEELEDTPNVDSEPVGLQEFLQPSKGRHDLASWTVLSSSPFHAPNFDHVFKQKGRKSPIKTSMPHLLAEVRDAPMGDFFNFKKVQDRLVQHVDVGLRRKRQAPERMSANTWGVALDDKKRKRTKLDANVRQSKKNTPERSQDIKKKGTNIKDVCITAQESKKIVRQVESNASFLSRIDVSNSHKGKDIKEPLEMQEAAVVAQYLTKGFNIALREQTSVINKKIDIFLPGNGGFSRSTFFQKMKGIVEKRLNNHVISIDRIRSNGEGTKMSVSNIFGKPLALHITVTERGGVALNEKVVLRCYKEHIEKNPTARVGYLVQINAGGQWKCESSLSLLISDIFVFAGYNVESKHVRAREESSVYSVTNRETFRSNLKNQIVSIDIPKLIVKMRGVGFAGVKPLDVTGGMSFQLDAPRCKPQIQKTGTIYMPFCADPLRVRLTILKIILPFAEEVLKGPPLAKGKRDSKGRGKLKTSTPMKPLESKEDIDDSRTKVHACDAWREGGRKRMR